MKIREMSEDKTPTTVKKEKKKLAKVKKEEPADEITKALMEDLTDIMKSHKLITNKMRRIKRRIRKRGKIPTVDNEFIEKVKEVRWNMNKLKLMVYNSLEMIPIQKCIRLGIQNCKDLFSSEDFSVNSVSVVNSMYVKVLPFNWYLEACRMKDGYLCLLLYALPQAGFAGHYRIETDMQFYILNAEGDKDLVKKKFSGVYQNDEEQKYSGWGVKNMAKFEGNGVKNMAKWEDLLNPKKGFLRTDGSIEVEVVFTIKSYTVHNLAASDAAVEMNEA